MATRSLCGQILDTVKIYFDTVKTYPYNPRMLKKRSYHHGALRDALIEAALAILEEDGLEALTLRGVAARAKVSHAAPAHHFATLKALRTALATIAFERFGKAMREAREAAARTPEAQLRSAGDGYLSFACANPALFRLMFAEALLDCEDPAYAEAARGAFTQLVEISAPAAEALGRTSEADRAEIIKLVWSVAHGYASLVLENQIRKIDAGAAPRTPDFAGLLFQTVPKGKKAS